MLKSGNAIRIPRAMKTAGLIHLFQKGVRGDGLASEVITPPWGESEHSGADGVLPLLRFYLENVGCLGLAALLLPRSPLPAK
jgi:hypothetical protein